jgi:hypothetical protein
MAQTPNDIEKQLEEETKADIVEEKAPNPDKTSNPSHQSCLPWQHKTIIVVAAVLLIVIGATAGVLVAVLSESNETNAVCLGANELCGNATQSNLGECCSPLECLAVVQDGGENGLGFYHGDFCMVPPE